MARPRADRRSGNFSTPARTTMIPLNDDSAEKSKRMKERSMLHEIQKQKMRAAASPANRRQTLTGAVDGQSPRTPRNIGGAGNGKAVDVIDAVTPLRKVPILANFEEWMKMATDNKINATNSWNFALIDYFHDMSLLKEGDGVNFQKASCTLDGCVKIYTSRVDSVATETGKLLSGLADNDSRKKGRNADEEGVSGDEDEDGEVKKTRKRVQRSSEATLVKDFKQLRIKKLELEFAVDPLFKKASADFDEGGAKGLLLNHLSIDNTGRIVFDSSDDRDMDAPKKDDDEEDEEGEEGAAKRKEPEIKEEEPDEPPVILRNLANLKKRFLPDLSKLDRQDVCPALKGFDIGDPNGTLDIPFLKSLDDKADDDVKADDMGGDGMAFGFDDGFGIADDDDMPLGFGEGGEAWANETIMDAADRLLSPSKRPMLGLGGADQEGEHEDDTRDFSVGFGSGRHEDILAYFDEALKKNWAGPEHWRIRRIKDNHNKATQPVRQRKEKETFEIDFMNPAADVPKALLEPPRSASTIVLPKKDRVSKTRHLLPDDKHFNSRQLLRLFLKPKASLFSRSKKQKTIPGEPEKVDEEFWARENMARELQAQSTPEPGVQPNYDANFFNDDALNELPGLPDDDDDDDFADARESFSPGPEAPAPTEVPLTQGGGFGTQLITQNRRVRPEYVQYARVAKKVDVRKLKENIWSGLGFEEPANKPEEPAAQDQRESTQASSQFDEPKKFTEVINNLKSSYEEKTMADISTSYCFICLLHLANEKGLIVEEVGDSLQELSIRKDATAGEADAY